MRCLICGSEATARAHGIVAPFIDQLASNDDRGLVLLLRCDECDLDFFSHRYSESELSAIYGGYRDPEYVAIRQRWEPWYRQAANDAFVTGSPEVEARRAFMAELIDQTPGREFRTAVDFGGDEGQFFPVSTTGRRIVIDVSAKPLLDGVESLPNFGAIGDAPDLVMICHVLEHLNEPAALLSETRSHLDPAGVLYVEVPLDRPRTHTWHGRAAYGRYLRWIRRYRWPLILADFGSGVARQFGLRIPRLGIVKQSEHINYFSETSLRRMLEASGFAVTASRSEPGASVGGLRLGKLGMVAVPTAIPPL